MLSRHETARGSGNVEDKVLKWLRDWEDLINTADFEKARRLFSENVLSFGTLAEILYGRAELEALQWRKIWPAIADFRFEEPKILRLGDDIVVVSLWHSKGKAKDGGWYARKGRATLVLKREKDEFRCVHSHLSMEPGIPPLAE